MTRASFGLRRGKVGGAQSAYSSEPTEDADVVRVMGWSRRLAARPTWASRSATPVPGRQFCAEARREKTLGEDQSRLVMRRRSLVASCGEMEARAEVELMVERDDGMSKICTVAGS
jgi:hypothetical protein